MIFNPYLSKQVQEVIFSRKISSSSFFQKHLGLTLNIKLNFSKYIKKNAKKVSKTTGLFCKFRPFSPRSSLLTISKTFVRSRLDYADIIFDQAYNSTFHDQVESV